MMHLFESAQIAMDIAVAAFKFENRIANQLSRAMVGHLPAARNAMDRHCGRWIDQKALVGAAS